MLATMQYVQYKLITDQYVHKFCFHRFLRLSINFRAFPFDEDNVKVSFWLFRERKEYELTLTGSIAKSTEHKHNSS